MENQRLFLFIALSLVILLLYSAWQEQTAPKPVASVEAPFTGQAPIPADQPMSPQATGQDVPSATPAGVPPSPSGAAATSGPARRR